MVLPPLAWCLGHGTPPAPVQGQDWGHRGMAKAPSCSHSRYRVTPHPSHLPAGCPDGVWQSLVISPSPALLSLDLCPSPSSLPGLPAPPFCNWEQALLAGSWDWSWGQAIVLRR